MKRRLLATLLCLCLVLTLLPAPAWAAEGATISVDGTTKTLAAAISEAAAGDTLQLTASFTQPRNDGVTISKDLTLDLNGQTITYNGLNSSLITVSGCTLTVTDSGTDGAIEATEANYVFYLEELGKLVVNGGTLSSPNGSSLIWNASNGMITINGGTVSASGRSYGTIFSGSGSRGAIAVTGGTVQATGEDGRAIGSDSGAVTVSGGTVEATGNNGKAIDKKSTTGTITVSGGIVRTTTAPAIYQRSYGPIVIKGGTVTSANTGAKSGTIYFATAPRNPQRMLTITDGTVENTAGPDEGYSVYFGRDPYMGGEVTSETLYGYYSHTGGTVGKVYPEPPPHTHAVSVDCSATEGEQVTFQPLTVDADGKLCVDGVALTPSTSGSSTWYTLPGGSYYLAGDITLNNTIQIIDANSAPVNLCLNGHTLDLGEGRVNIRDISSGKGVLNLCDCGAEGKVTSAHSGLNTNAATIEVSHQFSLYGGTVENTAASSGKNKSAVGVLGGFSLYGGKLVCLNGNGLWVSYQTDGATLSGEVTLQGGTDQADICFDYPGENAPLTLAGSLTQPQTPWRVAVKNLETEAMPLLEGWATHMGQANFTDYFQSATKGLFIGQLENKDLVIHLCAITQQPSAGNSYTVHANGAPAYQWYPATVTTADITTDNAAIYGEENMSGCYQPSKFENGKWTASEGYDVHHPGYFTLALKQGDKVTVTLATADKPSEGQIGLVRDFDEPGEYVQVWYRFDGNTGSYSYVGTAVTDGDNTVITYLIPADGSYDLRIDGLYRGDQAAPVITATRTYAQPGAALTAQTAPKLNTTGLAGGTYLCRVTWPNGTALDSDVVTYAPPAAHTHAVSVNCENDSGEQVTFQPLPDLSAVSLSGYTLSAGSYYLTADTNLGGSLTISGDVTLCLNGHTLSLSVGKDIGDIYAAISVPQGSSLTVCNCGQTKGKIAYTTNRTKGHAAIGGAGNVTLYGCAVETSKTSDTAAYGLCNMGGAFTLYDSHISATHTTSGADQTPHANAIEGRGGTTVIHGGTLSATVTNSTAYGDGYSGARGLNLSNGSTAYLLGSPTITTSNTTNAENQADVSVSSPEAQFWLSKDSESYGGAALTVRVIRSNYSDGGTVIRGMGENGPAVTIKNAPNGLVKTVIETEGRKDLVLTGPYTVKFDANGGEGTMADLAFTGWTDRKALTANGFTGAGGAPFQGWNTKADGSGAGYADGATVSALAYGGSVTLYAQWGAAPAAHTHAVSVNCENNSGEQVTFQALTSVDGALYVGGAAVPSEVNYSGETEYSLPAGHYYLPEDVTLADGSLLFLGGDEDVAVDLCLNGHTLDLGGSRSHIRVGGSGRLRMCDCGRDGAVQGVYTSDEGLGAMVNVSGELELYGGTVKNAATPGQDQQARAISLFSGAAVKLYGGQVIAQHDAALQYDGSAAVDGGLTLYDGVTLQGGPGSAEVWLCDILNRGNDAVLTIAQPLTQPEKPWRLASTKAQTLTAGWARHMGTADFGGYFQAVTPGRFLEKNAQGELALTDYAITQQPTAEDPTVAVNYAPQGIGYQWYRATVTTTEVADENAEAYGADEMGCTQPSKFENGKWTASQGTDIHSPGYFTFKDPLAVGEKVVVTIPTSELPTQGQLGLSYFQWGGDQGLVNSQLWYSFGGRAPSQGVRAVTEGGNTVITFTVPGSWPYRLMADGVDAPPAIEAKLVRVAVGAAVSGQTGKQLTANDAGSYLCRVTWPDGAALDSDVVAYTPPAITGVVDVVAGAPEVSVDTGALKDLAETPAEGERVTVKLTVEKQDDPAGKEDIQAVVTGDKENVLYLDLSLLKTTVQGGGAPTTEAITNTGDKVLEIKVPYSFTGKKDVTVYRKHDTSDAETLRKLTARPRSDFAEGSFFADSVNGAVYIYAGKFSTYAIGYTAQTTSPVIPSRPSRPSRPAWPFTDVKTTDDCYEAVKYVYEKGWMLGTSGTTFEPEGQLTRAMLATALYRAAGSPQVKGAPEFADAEAGSWYSDAVAWAAQAQVLRGYGNGNFGPEDPVSREMLNMVIGRLKGQDPVWLGDPSLAVSAQRWEVAAMLRELGAGATAQRPA